ncbi:MAG: acyltransferase [Leptolyngbya sp. SIO3F4]|nr:acyltransferase [Leptolyngbya sp. SIO3F4]
MPKERLFFIDFMKAICIIAVVFFHSSFVPISTYQSSAVALNILSAPLRFCVPVLLGISFFLLARSTNENIQPKAIIIRQRIKRLLIPTLFWFGIGIIKLIVQGKSFGEIVNKTIVGEGFTGAYYLLILFQLIPLALILNNHLRRKTTILVALLFQGLIYWVIQSSIKTSSIQSSDLFLLRSIGRPLLIYWFAYVALGIGIYQNFSVFLKLSHKLSKLKKFSLIGGLGVALMIEYVYLIQLLDNRVPPFEYVMYSCLLSVPIVFLCCTSIEAKDFPIWAQQIILLLSKYSLGIFCINGILSQVFLSFGSKWLQSYMFSFPEILAIRILSWGCLLVLSLYSSIMLNKIGMKKVVC